ncbi:MAG TPA: HAD family hydrolase [Dehalococcoidia bacterium]|nr:HAD family hydrolase [Dehalococcoidia bacterium]
MTGLLSSGVRAILFDMDGTLLDSNSLVAEAGSMMLREAGHQLSPDDVHLALATRTMRQLCQQVLGMTVAESETFYEGFLEVFYTEWAPQAEPLPHAERLLELVRDAGMRVALVTNRIERGGRAGVDGADWAHHFDVIVGQDTAGHAKPHPDPALHALAALDVEPTAAVFVGDNATDVGCGVSAGMMAVIAIAEGEKAQRLADMGATHVHADLYGVHETFFGQPPS